VQEACLRAFKYYDGFAGDRPKAWFLAIVRNTAFTWLKRNRPGEVESLEALGDVAEAAIDRTVAPPEPDPEEQLIGSRDAAALTALIESLPPEFREVVVLRELEDLAYREIAAIAGIPIGTVMSRLARARRLLQTRWRRQEDGG
jgi:RNA polymerase sigma factor (sigma-70 family)